MPTRPNQPVRLRSARAVLCAPEDRVNVAVASVTAAIGGIATGAYMKGFWNAPRKWSAPASIDVPANPSEEKLPSAMEARRVVQGGKLPSFDCSLLASREAAIPKRPAIVIASGAAIGAP